MNKINANTVSVRIIRRGLYSFEYKTPIRGDYYINISNDSELYDEWINNLESPSQSLLKSIVEKAKLGSHYSKNGIIIKYTSEVMWFKKNK